MSTSTDGILFFGFSLHDEADTPWCGDDTEDEDYGLEPIDVLAIKQGIELETHKARQEFEKTLACDVDYHCSAQSEIPYVYIKGFHYENSRGEVVDIPAPLPMPSQEKIQLLKEFCADLNIEWQEPGWKLVSYWG